MTVLSKLSKYRATPCNSPADDPDVVARRAFLFCFYFARRPVMTIMTGARFVFHRSSSDKGKTVGLIVGLCVFIQKSSSSASASSTRCVLRRERYANDTRTSCLDESIKCESVKKWNKTSVLPNDGREGTLLHITRRFASIIAAERKSNARPDALVMA